MTARRVAPRVRSAIATLAGGLKERVRQAIPRRYWILARGRWWLLQEACTVEHSLVLWPWTRLPRDPDKAFLHVESARLKRRRFRTVESRATVYVLSVLWPVVAIPHILAALRKNARDARRLYGVPIGRQLRQMWLLTVCYECPPKAYYAFRLVRHPAEASQRFVHPHIARELQGKFNSDSLARDLSDKRRFAEMAAERGLRVAPVLVTFADCRLHQWHVEPRRLPANDLVCKAVDLCRGQWFERWNHDGESRWVRGAERLDEAALLARCSARALDHGILLQEVVRNHRQLAPLAGKGLATVRLVTMRRLQRSAELLRAALRMPTGDSAMDNFEAGGVAAPVDLATGELGPAVMKSRELEDFDRHPDSKAPITGAVLPCWQDTKHLVLRAQDTFAEVPIIGWDVAITDDGPLLIEANPNWSVNLVQQPHGRPLGDTDFASVFAVHFKARFPEDAMVRRRGQLKRGGHAAS